MAKLKGWDSLSAKDTPSTAFCTACSALAGARAMGMNLPNTATAQELFNACAANGGADWDHSAMVRALELMAGHAVA